MYVYFRYTTFAKSIDHPLIFNISLTIMVRYANVSLSTIMNSFLSYVQNDSKLTTHFLIKPYALKMSFFKQLLCLMEISLLGYAS